MNNEVTRNEIDNYINDFKKHVCISCVVNLIPSEITIWYDIYGIESREHTGFSSFINED